MDHALPRLKQVESLWITLVDKATSPRANSHSMHLLREGANVLAATVFRFVKDEAPVSQAIAEARCYRHCLEQVIAA